MSAYKELAPFYDRLTEDVDHGAFMRFYEEIFDLYGKKPKQVLDLGCGTGTLTFLMAEQGYDMIGVDASEDMLAEAAMKAYAMEPERRPLFLSQRMEELDLYGTVEAAVCCLDGLNYVPRDALAEVFRRLRLFIEPDGLFIFDVNTPYKLRSLDGQAFVDETEDVYCVWRAELDEEEEALCYGMDIFSRAGRRWERDFEEHVEYIHTPETLTELLENAQFRDIRIFADKKAEDPAEDELRIFIAARNGRTD